MIPAETRQRVVTLRRRGLTNVQIAAAVGIHRNSVVNIVNACGLVRKKQKRCRRCGILLSEQGPAILWDGECYAVVQVENPNPETMCDQCVAERRDESAF